MFLPIPRASAVDACAARLREAVLAGQIAPGGRLPAERELSRRFGVNRITIRAALARLEGSRLLEVRHGSGYRVRDFLREGGPDLIGDLAAAAGKRGLARIAADLLLVRRQLAAAVLERLPSPLPEAHSAAVLEAAAAFAAAAAAGASAARLAALDLEVLARVVAATGSEVLQLCLNPVAALLGRLPALRQAIYRNPQRSLRAYQALLALFAGGEAPRGAMLEALRLHDEETLRELTAPRAGSLRAAPRRPAPRKAARRPRGSRPTPKRPAPEPA